MATKDLGPDSRTGPSPQRIGVFAAPVSGAGPWRLLHRETLRAKPDGSSVALKVSASTSRVLGALDGGPAHTVARMVQSRRYPLETFDWDGARVAYGEERCIDAATVVAGPQEPTETFGPLACPVEILSDSARLARDNSLGIQVRCADGCDGGELGFSKPGYLHYNNTPGRFVRFRVAPGKTQTVRIRLSRRQAARLRREGSVPARAKALSPYVNESKDVMLRAGK